MDDPGSIPGLRAFFVAVVVNFFLNHTKMKLSFEKFEQQTLILIDSELFLSGLLTNNFVQTDFYFFNSELIRKSRNNKITLQFSLSQSYFRLKY